VKYTAFPEEFSIGGEDLRRPGRRAGEAKAFARELACRPTAAVGATHRRLAAKPEAPRVVESLAQRLMRKKTKSKG
jgi:hypothetical protein